MKTTLNEWIVHFLDNAPTKQLIDVIDKWCITLMEIKEYNRMKKEEQEEKRKIWRRTKKTWKFIN